MRHSLQCRTRERTGPCRVKGCAEVTELLAHVSSCRRGECAKPGCKETSRLMVHHLRCWNARPEQRCTVCGPVCDQIQAEEEARAALEKCRPCGPNGQVPPPAPPATLGAAPDAAAPAAASPLPTHLPPPASQASRPLPQAGTPTNAPAFATALARPPWTSPAPPPATVPPALPPSASLHDYARYHAAAGITVNTRPGPPPIRMPPPGGRRRYGAVPGVDCPEDFRCAISAQIMVDPVMLVNSGQSYERAALLDALARRPGVDPLTGGAFEDAPLIAENRTFRRAIEAWRDAHGPAGAPRKRAKVGPGYDAEPAEDVEGRHRCSTCNKTNTTFSVKGDGSLLKTCDDCRSRARGYYISRRRRELSQNPPADYRRAGLPTALPAPLHAPPRYEPGAPSPTAPGPDAYAAYRKPDYAYAHVASPYHRPPPHHVAPPPHHVARPPLPPHHVAQYRSPTSIAEWAAQDGHAQGPPPWAAHAPRHAAPPPHGFRPPEQP